jgi:hypothetical protein
MKLFLHLGYYKTGSTAIQHSFARNKDYIERYDTCLPIAPRLLDSQVKGHISSGNGRLLRNAIFSGSLDSVADLIKHDIDAHKACNGFIYSSELLFYALADLNRLTLLKKALKIHEFSQINILLFVREPISHAISWHGELTKLGMTTSSITEYMEQYKLPTAMARLVKFMSETNDDLPVRLEFRNYSCLKNRVVDVAWDWLGIPVPKDKLSSNNIVNRSLTEAETEFCRQLAKAGCNPEFIARRLSISLPKIEPTYSKPSIESVEKMYSRHLESLEFINKYLPINEKLPLTVASADFETTTSPIDRFSFSSEQLVQIAKAIAPLLKQRYPLLHHEPRADAQVRAAAGG